MIENKIQTEVKEIKKEVSHVILKTHFLMIQVYIQNWRQTYYYRKRSISIS